MAILVPVCVYIWQMPDMLLHQFAYLKSQLIVSGLEKWKK